MTLNILALAKQVEELVKNGGGSGGTSDYEQLSKKPQINSHTLIGNKSAHDLGLATEEAVSGKSTVTANPAGTSAGDLSSIGINGTKYNIPSGGGSDVPDPTGQANYQVIGTRNGAYQLFEPNTLVRAVPNSTNEEDVGKVLTKYGTGSNQYRWESVGGGGTSEVTLFDGDVEAVSGSTGYFMREIPLANRIELCDGGHAKYKTLTFEASYVRSRSEDEKTETVNVSRTFDLERLLIGDAQTYNDPQYDTDDTAHVVLRNDELVEKMGGEKYLLTNLQINQNGTNPANNLYTGKFFRVTFQYYTINNGNTEYIDLPKEQKVRVKITAK